MVNSNPIKKLLSILKSAELQEKFEDLASDIDTKLAASLKIRVCQVKQLENDSAKLTAGVLLVASTRLFNPVFLLTGSFIGAAAGGYQAVKSFREENKRHNIDIDPFEHSSP